MSGEKENQPAEQPEADVPAPEPEGGNAPEAAAEAAAEGEEPDDESEGGEQESDEDKPKKQSRSQRYKDRIARLEADLERERWSKRDVPAAKEQPIEETIGPKPLPKDYKTLYDYQIAASGWEAAKRVEEAGQKRRATEAEAHETERLESLARGYEDKKAEFRAAAPDYDKVMAAARLQVSGSVADLLIESEHTARLEYHLAKNPQKLSELNRMRPLQAAREVGRLEALLSRPEQKRSTQAPPPARPLKGGAAGPTKSLADMDMKEFAAAYKARVKARA